MYLFCLVLRKEMFTRFSPLIKFYPAVKLSRNIHSGFTFGGYNYNPENGHISKLIYTDYLQKKYIRTISNYDYAIKLINRQIAEDNYYAKYYDPNKVPCRNSVYNKNAESYWLNF